MPNNLDPRRGGVRLNGLNPRGGSAMTGGALNPRSGAMRFAPIRNVPTNKPTQYGGGGAAAGFNNVRALLESAMSRGNRARNNYASDMDRYRNAVHGSPNPEPIVDPTQYTKTIQDFIEQARATLNSSKQSALSSAMNNIAGREAALKQQAETSDQNISKGYGALSAFISGQQAPIAQNYQTAIDQTAAAASDAQNAINQGNAAAVAQQNAIMQRLGIGDTNIVLQNTGTTNAAQTGANVADAAQRAQAARTRLSENQQTAQNFNTSSGTAAALEGRGAQNTIQQQLMNYMGKLQDERTAAQSASTVSEADVLSLAQQLLDQDRGIWEGNYQRKYQVEQDAQQNARAAIEDQMRAAQAPEMTGTAYSALGPIGQATYALQQSGVDPTQSKIIANALQQAYSTGTIRNVQDFIKLVQQNIGSNADPIDVANAASIYYQYFQ